MTATSLAAADNPDMKPHPRVPAGNRKFLRDSVRLLQSAAKAAEQPITSTEAVFTAAANLAYFARCVGCLITAPVLDAEGVGVSIDYLTRAIAHLTDCAESTRPAEMPSGVFETAQPAIFGLATDVDQWAYKHPYRLFLAWYESATRSATLLCEAAGPVWRHGPAASGASLALRLALANPPRTADLSDGYLSSEDVAALMFTDVYTLSRWMDRFEADPLPRPDLGRHPALWHADRAPELRAWWLRHDELPVSDRPAVTPGHRIGDQYLTAVR